MALGQLTFNLIKLGKLGKYISYFKDRRFKNINDKRHKQRKGKNSYSQNVDLWPILM